MCFSGMFLNAGACDQLCPPGSVADTLRGICFPLLDSLFFTQISLNLTLYTTQSPIPLDLVEISVVPLSLTVGKKIFFLMTNEAVLQAVRVTDLAVRTMRQLVVKQLYLVRKRLEKKYAVKIQTASIVEKTLSA